MMSIQSLLITVALAFYSFNAIALDVCTVTVNSSDEKNVLKSFYKDATFNELVPDNKDPDWLEKACQAGVRCDVLLVSGHFGGIFFGEKSSSILSLEKLQDLSCQNKCPGILNAKKVMLMGCNTLATKKPDHRSIEKYISVLVHDGFPQNLAEEVASSRYSDFGLSMSERMAVAFPKAESIYGFESTSPLGVVNGPHLKRALESQNNSLDESMKNNFSSTSFKVIKPQKIISETTLKNSCGVRQAARPEIRSQTYEDILKMPDYSRYFDQLIRQRDDQALMQTWQKLANESLSQKLRGLSNDVIANASIMIGLQLKVIKLQKNLNLMTMDSYKSKAYSLIQGRLRSGLDYIALDQLCTVAKELPELKFQNSWLSKAPKSELSYYAHLAGCFSRMDEVTKNKLADFSLDLTGQPSLVRESLRTMEGLWTPSQKAQLNTKLGQAEGSVKSEMIASLQLNLFQPAMEDCMAAVSSGSAADRDKKRWNCFNQNSKSLTSIQECQAAAGQFETTSGLGAQWHCLKNFSNDLSIANCTKAAAAVKNAEKSDDFLLGCWDQIKKISASHPNSINKSECLRISESLKIYGNRIKQNWNCVTGVKK